MNPKRPTPRHTVTKMSKVKDKERLLKSARLKQLVMYKGTPIDYQQIFQQKLGRPEGVHNILKVITEEKFQPRILYVASPSAHRSAFKERDKTSKC